MILQINYNKCIERATTVEPVVGSERSPKPLDPATSMWVYFKGLSEESWWFVKPDTWWSRKKKECQYIFHYFYKIFWILNNYQIISVFKIKSQVKIGIVVKKTFLAQTSAQCQYRYMYDNSFWEDKKMSFYFWKSFSHPKKINYQT